MIKNFSASWKPISSPHSNSARSSKKPADWTTFDSSSTSTQARTSITAEKSTHPNMKNQDQSWRRLSQYRRHAGNIFSHSQKFEIRVYFHPRLACTVNSQFFFSLPKGGGVGEMFVAEGVGVPESVYRIEQIDHNI
jgi:hypothetical protein